MLPLCSLHVQGMNTQLYRSFPWTVLNSKALANIERKNHIVRDAHERYKKWLEEGIPTA